MKRKLIIIPVIFVLLLGILALLPYLYKDKLLAKVKSTLNSQINAKIDFTEFSLSLFAQFPKVEMELKNLSLTGINEFAGDTIFSAGSVSTNISLMEMIRGEGLELNTLIVKNPRISLISGKTGSVNWDIAKTTEATASTSDSEVSQKEPFKIKLKDIQVTNLNLRYNDLAMPMKVWVKNANLNSSGDVVGSLTSIDMKADAGEFIFEYDSVE
jgi:hypothetical protein